MEKKTYQIAGLEPSWAKALADQLNQPYLIALAKFVAQERASGIPIYPPQNLVFNAFNHTPYDQVKVVIIGQDPYHGAGQAHGLSFSVPNGVRHPPSLQNIFKELSSDLGVAIPTSGSLIHWAEQGVLLLNAALTVREGKPLSHQGQGWERFTDAVVAKLSEREDPIIFVLWGKFAQEKCKFLIANSKHPILTAPHPSPFSAHQGFFGCRHFSKINQLLISQGRKQINW